MSKVDDGGDAQRIREMAEAQLRRKLDNEKRSQNERLEKSFGEVMGDRARRGAAQRETARQAEAEQGQAAKRVLDLVRKGAPKQGHELARHAALTQAMHKGLTATRGKEADQAKGAESARVEDLTTKGEVEQTFVDRTTRDDDEREVRGREDRQADAEQALKHEGGPLAPVGEDDQRRKDPRQGRGSQGRDENRSDGVASAQGAAGASAPQLPPEVLKQIVGAIYKGVTQDGRTHMQITLKGGLLDGVQLQVRAEGGKVSCEFSGCSKETARLLDSAQGALARGLERRGLRLERLSAR